MFALVQNDPKSLLVLGEVRTLPLLSQCALRLAYLSFIWTVRSRSRKALRRLSDTHLADIGFTRHAAAAEAAKWFWQA